MIRHIYSAAYALALPFIFPSQLKKRPHGSRGLWLRQKLGRMMPRTDNSPLLWVHAVSVGEAVTAVTFIEAFIERHRDYRVVVSTVTDTGRKVAMAQLEGKAEVVYLPFDLPVFIDRAIKSLRPSLFVVMETEIWPNLFHCMKRYGVPVALLNGRISEKSFGLYRKLGSALGPVLSSVDIFSMQNDMYAKRVIKMGAAPSKVHNTGSFKFDLRLDRKELEWASGLKRPVVVAGSTHRGEEELMAGVLKGLLAKRQLSMILVPRHPERVPEVEGVLSAHGLTYVRRSAISPGQRPTVDVVLVDTVGELTSIYEVADVAVIGGSFIPHGGQNPLEPAYWSKPVVCGPYMDNFPFIDQFYESSAALRVESDNLMAVVDGLLESEERRNEMGRRASDIIERNRGAVHRALELVDGLIGKAQ